MWFASVGLFTGKLSLVSQKNTWLQLSFFVVPVRNFQPVALLPGSGCWTCCDLMWLNTCHSRVRFSVLSFEEHERRQEVLRVLTRGLCCIIRITFLGALAKLRKATICFIMSVCPSAGNCSVSTVRIFMNFDMRHFRKSVERIQVLLKSDKNSGYITRKHMYISNSLNSGFIGLQIACWPLVPKFAPGRSRRIFRAKKSSARHPSEGK
jgi:hypothetical protein